MRNDIIKAFDKNIFPYKDSESEIKEEKSKKERIRRRKLRKNKR